MSLAVDEQQLREVALTQAEYDEIVDRLGREPNLLELGMLGVLWSEHCSYKTSRPLLRRPTTGPRARSWSGRPSSWRDVDSE